MRSGSTTASSSAAPRTRTNGVDITCYLPVHLSDEEWDAVALGYGEGVVASTLLEGLSADEWRREAQEILENVDKGCKVLLTRAHKKGSDAGPVIAATE